MKRPSLSAVALGLIVWAASASSQTAKQPVYVYLYARVTDHVNLNVTEDRLHRLLPMIEKYRKEHPEFHISATILFSGAVSQALMQRNGQDHIVDFVRGYIREGVINPGYDGADEPTYQNRPLLDFSTAQKPEDRWRVRTAADEKFLSQGRDPLTGAPEPGATGGLKAMREIFGDPVCVTGMTMWMNVRHGSAEMSENTPGEDSDPHFNRPLTKPAVFRTGLKPEVGGDTELIQLLQRDGIHPIMFGIPDSNPGFIPGFNNGRKKFGELMSPVPETSPELFWQDNILRSSEASGTVRLVHGYDGPEGMKAMIEKADRSRIHVVHVELASEQNYLQPGFIKGTEFPPLRYAYDHPQNAALPDSALQAPEAVSAAYAKEEALMKWMFDDFLPGNPGSRVVSSTELRRMAAPSDGFRIKTDALRAALSDYLKLAGNNTILPPSFRADGQYLSLAEMFQVMTDSLAEFSRTGKIPESVKVDQVYGPVELLTGHGPNDGEVSVASIARVCGDIDAGLHDHSGGVIPKNVVPNFVKVDAISMTPAQFLRLMAQALQNPALDEKLPVRMTYSFTGTLILYPKLRNIGDAGFGWTLKPAVLNTPAERG